ncbi:hypothetical protein [Eubacterium sp.]
MTKFFKRTFAFFVAVIMMISSFPYMALAEDTASATEGSTTAEMTNAELEKNNKELKKYIDEKIVNASVKLPAETNLNKVPIEFHKGIVTNSSWIHPYSKNIYSENEKDIFIKFYLDGLGDAVALYTGENNDICFPITANFNRNLSNEPKFDLYIKNISLNYQSNFQFGNDWWDRCTDHGNLNSNSASDEQQFISSKPTGDRKNDNVYFNSLSSNKSWRNYIKYTGSGNTDSYYEKLPTEFQLELVYKCRNPVTSNRYTETKKLELDHCMYVLNMKPYKDIVTNLKTDYDAVKSNESKYTPKALNNYYKAVRDVLDFDIKTLLSNMTLNKPKVFSKEIVDIATKVKNVVENYNLAKKVNMDSTAFKAEKEKCDIIINNQRENAEYDSNSFAEFKKKYDEVILKAETVENQEALDKLTDQLITAQNSLQKRKLKITFKIYKNNSSSAFTTKVYEDMFYGQKYVMDLASFIDENKECAKRWIVYTDDHKTRTIVGTTDSNFTLYVTKDATIEAYVVPLKENDKPEEYSKVVFYGFNNRVIDVQYLKKGETLDKYTTKAPDVPFYQFDSWDKTSVIGTGKDIAVKAKYTPKQVQTDGCTVYYTGFKDGKKTYSYDSFVSLAGATDNEYFALATTANGENADGSSSILTYLNCNEFHAPKRSEIYVVPVKKEDRVAKVAITGNYATKIDKDGNIASGTDFAKKRAVFNCKFYLPEGCEAVEWGARISANNKTMAVKSNKNSKYNEYSIYMNVPKNSSITAFTAVAYVTYKDSEGKYITIESKVPVTQEFN